MKGTGNLGESQAFNFPPKSGCLFKCVYEPFLVFGNQTPFNNATKLSDPDEITASPCGRKKIPKKNQPIFYLAKTSPFRPFFPDFSAAHFVKLGDENMGKKRILVSEEIEDLFNYTSLKILTKNNTFTCFKTSNKQETFKNIYHLIP